MVSLKGLPWLFCQHVLYFMQQYEKLGVGVCTYRLGRDGQ